MPGHTKCCTCHAKSSSQNWRSDAPKCNLLRKSAPGPPNSSDLYRACHGKCIFADPLQVPHACHRFWKCYKSLTFCSLLTRCTVPCACHAKRHLNVQNYSEHVVFLAFWLRNLLRATTACTFSTSQLPKAVWTWCALYILTSKRASRHNGAHFFEISTSKTRDYARINPNRTDTFALAGKQSLLHLILCIAQLKGWKLVTLDVKDTYLMCPQRKRVRIIMDKEVVNAL